MKRRFTFLFLISTSLFGFDENIEKLLSQATRPTIREIKEALGEIEENPMSKISDFEYQYDQTLLNQLPPVIARFEGLCPHAHFFALGRDIVLTAEILEAFYDSIKQGDRVHRIPMSGGSFSRATPENLLSVLQGSGLDLNEIGKRPQIIFDRTRLSEASQSTRLLRALFDQGKKQGLDSNNMAGKLFVATTYNGVSFAPNQEEKFRQYFRDLINKEGFPSFPVSMAELSQWTGGYEWHATFGLVVTGAHGFLEGSLGAPKPRNNRELILSRSIDFILYMKKPQMLDAVRSELAKYGLELSSGESVRRERKSETTTTTSTSHRQAEDFEERRVRLSTIFSNLSIVEEHATYLSMNGKKLEHWLNVNTRIENPNTILFYFVEQLLEGHQKRRVSDRDLRRLIARAFGKMTTPDEVLLKKFHKLVEANSRLQRIVTEKRGVFLNSSKNDSKSVAETFLYLQGFGCADIISNTEDST